MESCSSQWRSSSFPHLHENLSISALFCDENYCGMLMISCSNRIDRVRSETSSTGTPTDEGKVLTMPLLFNLGLFFHCVMCFPNLTSSVTIRLKWNDYEDWKHEHWLSNLAKMKKRTFHTNYSELSEVIWMKAITQMLSHRNYELSSFLDRITLRRGRKNLVASFSKDWLNTRTCPIHS